jgi:P pilus assembly chaperone PapD
MKRIIQLGGVFVVLVCFYAQSYAGLLINPKRIVLEDRERAASLDLLNDGTETARYQIYFEQKTMNLDGAIVPVEDPDANGPHAKDMVRYSPRRVDIEPGGRQTIRVAARRPKDLVDGEYLSHLVFKEIPVLASEEKGEDDEDLTVALKPTLTIAIPIIVRKGELDSKADLTDIKWLVEEGKHGAVSYRLHREGSASLYGTTEVFEIRDGEVGERVAVAKGVGLYTTVPSRLVKVRLARPLDPEVKQLLVRYDEDEKYGGTNLVEQVLSLP